jgi:hypothetical protein
MLNGNGILQLEDKISRFEYHAARVPKKSKHKKFQVNLHFSKSQFSACGYGRAYISHTLQGLIAKIKDAEQIQTDQIIFTFQPE